MQPGAVAAHMRESDHHWYFQGRRAVLRAVIDAVRPPGRLRVLELGCGDGNVLAGFTDLGEVVGIEPDPELAAAARARGLDVRPGRLPHDLPVPEGWADLLLMIDVLEHLDDDAAALSAVRRLLRPGGTLVAAVPAYRWLWSRHDTASGHRRRYVRRQLDAVVAGAGFRVERVTYFNTLLFPAIAAATLGGLRGEDDLKRPAPWLNRALAAVFAAERFIVPQWRLPFGVALLVVGRRP